MLWCANILPRQAKQNVGELWRVTTDPSDPVFYSSCSSTGQKRISRGFGGEACELKIQSFKYGVEICEQCISCNDDETAGDYPRQVGNQ